MQREKMQLIRDGLETAYVNGNTASELLYKPNFVSNNHNEGKKVLSVIEDELLKCDKFQISVAFITLGGVTPLLQTLKELEKREIPGEILTSNYLDFSEPQALEKLNSLKNIRIKMYDTNGEKIYSVKTTLSGDGYPIDISISSDAKKLIASFIKVSGDEIKTNVVFYNFSDVGKNETERVVGGFNYDDIIVGDVKFVNDTTAVAVGENVVSIYKIKEYPSLEHTINIDNEIQKIFCSDQYIGLVLDNSESGDPYKLVVYNISGKHIFDTTFGIQYTDMQFDGKSVVMSNASTFVLLNMSGKKLADISFDMPVINVLPTGARGSYTIVNSKYIQSIKLK